MHSHRSRVSDPSEGDEGLSYLYFVMAKILTNLNSAGKDPIGFAATILYMSCLKTGEDTTQTQMADAAGVTDVTIRSRLRDLKIKLKLKN